MIGNIIRRAALYYRESPCLTEGDRTISFREFDRLTDRLGNALLEQGLRQGDRVAVLLPNGIDCLVAYYALAKAGLVRVGLNTRETLKDHRYKLSDCGARALIYEGGSGFGLEFEFSSADLSGLLRAASERQLLVERLPEAPYRIAYTGGTTGQPRGVTIVPRGELWEVGAFLLDLIPNLAAGDVFLHGSPIAHASGAFVLPSLVRGVHSILMPKFDALQFVHLLRTMAVTHTFLVPAMIAMLLDQTDLNRSNCTLRSICYGAAPIAPSVLSRAQQRLGRIFSQTYGQAQSPMVITYLAPEHHDRVGSCGRPYTCAEVAIVDDQDRFLPPGTPGEIVCRGPQVMAGYWNRPEETAQVMRNRWLHTGDIGREDADGFFYILDRKDDVLISGGYNIYPREIEDALLSFEGILEAAVIGLPDDTWGDRVHAVVAGTGAIDTVALLAFAREKLAGFKCPKSIEIWPSLPKSAANKILRRVVRESVLSKLAQTVAPHGESKPV